uniref:Secreted peptide n=1 Tax=Anopheles braziliensis TaxID=58242 RepID=A0A2M3ZLX5_9DIPT
MSRVFVLCLSIASALCCCDTASRDSLSQSSSEVVVNLSSLACASSIALLLDLDKLRVHITVVLLLSVTETFPLG